MDGDGLGFEIRRSPRARTRPRNAPRCWPTPASAGSSPTTWSRSRYAEGKGWYDARVEPRAPLPHGPGDAPCCTTRRRSSRGSRPTGAPTAASTLFRPDANAAPLRRTRRAGWPWRSCPSDGVPRRAAPARHRSTTTGCPTRRGAASTCGRSCIASEVVPRRAARRLEYLFVVIASPAGVVLHRRRQAGHRLGLDATTPGPRPAAPARRSAAATTPPACRPRPRRSSTAATRSSSSTRSSAGRSTSSAA